MVIKFTKMEGCANDFIMIRPSSDKAVASIIPSVVSLCDRRRGIGADGVIFALPSRAADFRMRIFNSDGSEAEMCGNGIRCFARYVRDTRVSKRRTLAIETLAGLIHTEFKAGLVKVTMSTPILNAPDIPVALPSGPVLMHKVTVDDTEVAISAVSMGNPHAVIFAHELTDELVLRCGEKFQSHPLFPKKVNVEFVQVLSDREIRMRVYERGCGETMACGTGACAAVVAGILNKRHGNSVTVHLLGGDLFIEWSGSTSDPVYMSGPARKVFTGSVEMGKRSS